MTRQFTEERFYFDLLFHKGKRVWQQAAEARWSDHAFNHKHEDYQFQSPSQFIPLAMLYLQITSQTEPPTGEQVFMYLTYSLKQGTFLIQTITETFKNLLVLCFKTCQLLLLVILLLYQLPMFNCMPIPFYHLFIQPSAIIFQLLFHIVSIIPMFLQF